MAVVIRIFSDFTCPFCYIGAGMIEELKKEFDIREEWVSYELHPETPQESVLLAERFPDYDLDGLFEELRRLPAFILLEDPDGEATWKDPLKS